MTRIEELREIAENNNRRWLSYYQSCWSLVIALHDSLRQFLGLTSGELLYVPTIGEYDPSTKYTLADALRMGDDSFFYIGLQFMLLEEPVLIPFKIKTIPEGLYEEHEIEIENQDRVFEVHGSSPIAIKVVCKYVFELVKEDIEQSMERWWEQGGEPVQSVYAFYRPYPPEKEPYLPFQLPETTEPQAVDTQPPRHWITTEDAVHISGYHPEYVRRLARQGKIGAVRKGRDWWIDRDALQEYLYDKDKLGNQKFSPKLPVSTDKEQ